MPIDDSFSQVQSSRAFVSHCYLCRWEQQHWVKLHGVKSQVRRKCLGREWEKHHCNRCVYAIVHLAPRVMLSSKWHRPFGHGKHTTGRAIQPRLSHPCWHYSVNDSFRLPSVSELLTMSLSGACGDDPLKAPQNRQCIESSNLSLLRETWTLINRLLISFDFFRVLEQLEKV